jgi:hypothetical protein
MEGMTKDSRWPVEYFNPLLPGKQRQWPMKRWFFMFPLFDWQWRRRSLRRTELFFGYLLSQVSFGLILPRDLVLAVVFELINVLFCLCSSPIRSISRSCSFV